MRQSKCSQDCLVMCFEGPYKEDKQRARATMLEYDCYGEPPKPEHFSWSPDIPPSAEELRQESDAGWWAEPRSGNVAPCVLPVA